MGSLPYVPHPHDDTKGAQAPLWNPPHNLLISRSALGTPGVRGGSLFGEGAEPP